MNYTEPFFVPHKMAVRLGKKTSFYLPPLEPRQMKPPRPSPAPAMDYFQLGRMAYLQHEVESLKKGYHTHKNTKQRDIV